MTECPNGDPGMRPLFFLMRALSGPNRADCA
jgi:hypothetical protein